MIPAQAVEAAARVTFEAQTFNDWDKLDPKIKHIWIRNARRALEAAAPHLLETGKGKGPIVVPVPRSAVTNLYRTTK